MTKRKIKNVVQGFHAVDGAGVHLTRVLGRETIRDYDPFLMFDSFDSTNPNDYIKGFPWHPHRGIETITYLIHGSIEHKDSLGNRGVINEGCCQWMNSGSGIMHQEMPAESPRLLGFQMWLNLPEEHKMSKPSYKDIKKEDIPVVEKNGALIRVIAGAYDGIAGAPSNYVEATLYDVSLPAQSSISFETKSEEEVMVFLFTGDAKIQDEIVKEKSAVSLQDGIVTTIESYSNSEIRFLYASAKPLHEDVAWGGPIVMNTNEQLQRTFEELNEGTFIKDHEVVMD